MRIGIVSTKIYEDAIKAKNELIQRYNFIDIEATDKIQDVDIIVVLGGDGFMLRAIHKYYKYSIPFFGINYGNVGFLLNNKDCLEGDLVDVMEKAEKISINPLKNEIVDINDNIFTDISINELTLIRNVYKTCDIDIFVNNIKQVANYSGDGLVVSTPIGSTAYNSSLGGPIISHESNNIILSTISPFRPRTLKSVILQNTTKLEFNVNYYDVRQVSAFADFVEYKNIIKVETQIDKNINITLLFNDKNSFNNKIIQEQFKY
ncbi:MAG: NAD kinase [Rickettsiales bacterium]|nr:NAD kinase [Rickettsiales bacterium]